MARCPNPPDAPPDDRSTCRVGQHHARQHRSRRCRRRAPGCRPAPHHAAVRHTGATRARRGPDDGRRSHQSRGIREPADPRGPRPLPHVLRTRPRPHPARQRLSPACREDAGLRLPGRPPADQAHPRARGRPGGHFDLTGAGAQRRAHRGHRPRARLRARARWPRERGRIRPVHPRGVSPRRLGSRCRPGPAQPVRRDARRDPQPLVVPSDSRDARGRGRVLGRPVRLLRGGPGRRGLCAHRLARRPPPVGHHRARPRPVHPAAQPHHRVGHQHQRTGADLSRRPARRGTGRPSCVQLRACLQPARLRRAGRVGRGGAQGAGGLLRRRAGAHRRVLPGRTRRHQSSGVLCRRHDRPLRLRHGRRPARLAGGPSARGHRFPRGAPDWTPPAVRRTWTDVARP